MNALLYPIVLPLVAGTISFIIPKKRKAYLYLLAFATSLATLLVAIYLFMNRPLSWQLNDFTILRVDSLSSFILLAIALFGFLIILYSLRYMGEKQGLKVYYANLLWTIGAACGVVLSNNLILFLTFWGFLGITLYLLINLGGEEAAYAAKKTFIIIGGSDALILLGIAIIWQLTGSFQMDGISISLNGGLPLLAYLSLAIGAFAKAGAMPFHTWIPDMAESAPVSVTAFLPASLDKLLGIYLLARISLNLFIMNKALGLVLLIVGAVTIIAAVMMALIQHDLKRLLSYHAVSQVGYMVLGIGTGNPIGIAGGLFHMLNHAIYKGCLFLCGGGVEHQTRTSNLNKLGGLAKAMPITFVTCLIAALSISGIPPFNGFVSKWMVYQGVIELGKTGDRLWVIWLIAAMFGSALTLASFMKLIHAIFLGQRAKELAGKRITEVPWTMWLPMVILAGLCILFGVFAISVPLRHFILPAVEGVSFLGFWSPALATLLIIIGIIIGLILYGISNLRLNLRRDTSFIGGEVIPDEYRVSGVDFYNTVKELSPLKGIYKKAEDKFFDIYDQGKRLTLFFTRRLQHLHSGILPTYLVWCLVGMLVLFFVLMR